MKRIILIMATMAITTGCVETLPPKVSIAKNFNTADVKTVSVKMDCTKAKIDDIDPASVPDFCQMLHAAVKTTIRKKTGYALTDSAADLNINIKLEEIYGGNAAARFWVGMCAGRSAITTLVDIVKDGKVIAEGRFTETSTMPNIAGNAWSNDEMIMQDTGIIGGRIAEFVANPKKFDSSLPRPDLETRTFNQGTKRSGYEKNYFGFNGVCDVGGVRDSGSDAYR